tara:strand:+ start:461 stop:979 length:519 start_codon:yes stop_codon:yes gene_type:complete
MADMLLSELASHLDQVSRKHLMVALHRQAIKYAALSEKKAKHKASAVLTPRTGHLVQSITGRPKKKRNEIVIALSAGGGRKDVKYAKTHEQDGFPGSYFTIRPRNSKYLVFPVSADAFTEAGVARGGGAGSAWVSVKQVRIPSRPFLRPTWKLIQKKMVKDITEAVGREILG